MLNQSFEVGTEILEKPNTVDEYVAQVPAVARPQFDTLRSLVRTVLPHAQEVLSYGIVGYKIDDKRARVYISGWKDHVAMYPIPNNDKLKVALKPYAKSKGTLWFSLDRPLDKQLIEKTVRALVA